MKSSRNNVDDDVENKSDSRDPYLMAIALLHISIVPETLPCRNKEKTKIEDFIRHNLQKLGAVKPMYISGMPGSGKSCTVASAVAALMQDASIPKFKCLEINCLRLRTPIDACKIYIYQIYLCIAVYIFVF